MALKLMLFVAAAGAVKDHAPTDTRLEKRLQELEAEFAELSAPIPKDKHVTGKQLTPGDIIEGHEAVLTPETCAIIQTSCHYLSFCVDSCEDKNLSANCESFCFGPLLDPVCDAIASMASNATASMSSPFVLRDACYQMLPYVTWDLTLCTPHLPVSDVFRPLTVRMVWVRTARSGVRLGCCS